MTSRRLGPEFDLDPYNGPLSRDVILYARMTCLENAEGLIEDARVLLKNGRFPRAAALCILSFEELGKIILLTGALLYHDQAEWSGFWKKFRNHKSKRKIVASIEADMWGSTTVERLEAREEEEFIEKMKLLCLYVDSIDAKIYTPMKSFGPTIGRIASDSIKFAEGRAAMFRFFLTQIPTAITVRLADGLQELLAHRFENPQQMIAALTRLVDTLRLAKEAH